MSKLKSVKLKKNISSPTLSRDYSMGTNLIKSSNNCWRLYYEMEGGPGEYPEGLIMRNPSWFEIEEDKKFEIDPCNKLCNSNLKILVSSGEILLKSSCNIDNLKKMVMLGNVGSSEQIEYKKMFDETMFYMKELANYLNGDWKYKGDGDAKVLVVDYSISSLQKDLRLVPIPNIGIIGPKFKPTIVFSHIANIIKQEMYENYRKILLNSY